MKTTEIKNQKYIKSIDGKTYWSGTIRYQGLTQLLYLVDGKWMPIKILR